MQFCNFVSLAFFWGGEEGGEVSKNDISENYSIFLIEKSSITIQIDTSMNQKHTWQSNEFKCKMNVKLLKTDLVFDFVFISVMKSYHFYVKKLINKVICFLFFHIDMHNVLLHSLYQNMHCNVWILHHLYKTIWIGQKYIHKNHENGNYICSNLQLAFVNVFHFVKWIIHINMHHQNRQHSHIWTHSDCCVWTIKQIDSRIQQQMCLRSEWCNC